MSSWFRSEYRDAAREAGLDDDQLQRVERLVEGGPWADGFASHLMLHDLCDRLRTGRIGFDAVLRIAAEQADIQTRIRSAFSGVSRKGGVSWNEAWEIDCNGSEEECAAARAADDEPSWEALVDDPEWRTSGYPGAWPFLDAIGLRYYLAPAMVRDTRILRLDSADGALNRSLRDDEAALLTSDERAAVAAFLGFLARSQRDLQNGSDDELLAIARRWGCAEA